MTWLGLHATRRTEPCFPIRCVNVKVAAGVREVYKLNNEAQSYTHSSDVWGGVDSDCGRTLGGRV